MDREPGPKTGGSGGIVQVCMSKSWGGLEMHVPILSRLLIEQDQDVAVVCRGGSPIEGRLAGLGIPHLALGGGDYIAPRAVRSMRRFLREGKPGIVHSHHSKDLWKVVPALGGSPEVRLVHTRHINSGVRKNDFLHRWLFGRVDGWVATSEDGRANLLDTHPVDAGKVHVVNYGVDFSKISRDRSAGLRVREEFGIGREKIVIGMLGRMTPRKGHTVLFKAAFSILREERDRVVFLVVGGPSEGEAAYGEFLEETVVNMGLRENVVMPGHREDVRDMLSAMDIYVLPTDKESFGISLLEAMSNGLPVVATAVGGPLEVVEDGESGILIPPRDPGRLAEVLLQLIRDPGLRERLAEGAMRRVKERFSEESMVKGVLDVYEKVCLDRGPEGRP